MNFVLKLILSLIFISCSSASYKKDVSYANALKKINLIKEHVKKAELEGKSSVFIKLSKGKGCSSKGISGIELSNNLAEESRKDFDKVIEDNFLVLRKELTRKRAGWYRRDAWVTYYLIGDGSIILAHAVDADNGISKRRCSGSKYFVEYKETLYVGQSINSRDKITVKNVFNQNIDNLNESKFLDTSRNFDRLVRRDKDGFFEQMDKRDHYNSIASERREREKKARAQRDAQHMRELQARINNNMKFFSGNTNYIKEQNRINDSKSRFKGSTYKSKPTYTSKPPKITSVHEGYYHNAILTIKDSRKKNGINYYRNQAVTWPTGTFQSCNEKFTPVIDFETKFRKECTSRFGSSDEIASQCATQGANKARSVFLSRYRGWFDRKCPEVAAGKSSGKNDYEK